MLVKLILTIWDLKIEAQKARAEHWLCGADVLAVVNWV